MAFDIETLESLLNMEEGTTLDFKRKQYRFNKATDEDKSELLKDILAFANTQRYRTAYILVGVEEVKGGRSEVVGVDDHLDDANLHQFVNCKTNRPVVFSYFPFQVEGKEIGVLDIPIQNRPVYTLKGFGKVDSNTVYMRDGSSTRTASPDEIAAMGRGTPPKWSIDRLMSLAKNAVIDTVQQWREHPYRYSEYGEQHKPPTYEEAREGVRALSELNSEGCGVALLEEYPCGIDSYGSLYYVFQRFEELALTTAPKHFGRSEQRRRPSSNTVNAARATRRFGEAHDRLHLAKIAVIEKLAPVRYECGKQHKFQLTRKLVNSCFPVLVHPRRVPLWY